MDMKTPINAKSAVLQALREGELTALEIISFVRSKTDGKIVLAKGNVYPALDSLVVRGLVKIRTTKSESTGRRCRRFLLTKRGETTAGNLSEAVLSLYGD
jgi:DNA-binding PadR family transcriptional regulator